MVRAVRGVQVDHQVRVPVVQQLHERARLGGLELHEVAIEIEAVGVLARADAAERAELLRAVVEADALVAVRVVERRDDHDDARQHRSQVADREPPGDDERGFLPLHFARVDVGQHEHARAARAARIGGVHDGRRCQDGHRQRTAFLRLAEAGHAHIRAGGRQAVQHAVDVVCTAGLLERGGLSPRAQVGRCFRAPARARDHHRQPKPPQPHAKSSHRTTSLTQPIG